MEWAPPTAQYHRQELGASRQTADTSRTATSDGAAWPTLHSTPSPVPPRPGSRSSLWAGAARWRSDLMTGLHKETGAFVFASDYHIPSAKGALYEIKNRICFFKLLQF